VGTKWRFLDETKHGVSVSTYPQFTFNNPTASVRRGLADDGWQMFLPLEVSKTLGRFQAGGEIGYNLRRKAANEVWLGVVGAFQAARRVQLLAELHSVEARRFADNESVFRPRRQDQAHQPQFPAIRRRPQSARIHRWPAEILHVCRPSVFILEWIDAAPDVPS